MNYNFTVLCIFAALIGGSVSEDTVMELTIFGADEEAANDVYEYRDSESSKPDWASDRDQERWLRATNGAPWFEGSDGHTVSYTTDTGWWALFRDSDILYYLADNREEAPLTGPDPNKKWRQLPGAAETSVPKHTLKCINCDACDGQAASTKGVADACTSATHLCETMACAAAECHSGECNDAERDSCDGNPASSKGVVDACNPAAHLCEVTTCAGAKCDPAECNGAERDTCNGAAASAKGTADACYSSTYMCKTMTCGGVACQPGECNDLPMQQAGKHGAMNNDVVVKVEVNNNNNNSDPTPPADRQDTSTGPSSTTTAGDKSAAPSSVSNSCRRLLAEKARRRRAAEDTDTDTDTRAATDIDTDTDFSSTTKNSHNVDATVTGDGSVTVLKCNGTNVTVSWFVHLLVIVTMLLA